MLKFLLDFVSKELGCYFYNRGLYDAQTVVNARFEEMAEAIVVLEKFRALKLILKTSNPFGVC